LGDPEDDSRCATAKRTTKAREHQTEQRANPAPRLSELRRRRVYII